MAMTLEEFERRPMPLPKKCECGKMLVFGDKIRLSSGEEMCGDCYYGTLGEEIDRNPIFMPRRLKRA